MSTKLSRKKLAKVLLGYIKSGQKDQAMDIAAYLVSQKQTKDIASLERDLMQLQAQDGTLEITTTSAHPLTDDIRQTIKNLLPAKKHIVHETINEDVVGAVRVETVDTQLDLSVASQLNKLKNMPTGEL